MPETLSKLMVLAETLIATLIVTAFSATMLDLWPIVVPGVGRWALLAAFALAWVPPTGAAYLVWAFLRGGSISLARTSPTPWILANAGCGATLMGLCGTLLVSALPARYTNVLALDPAVFEENPFGARLHVGQFAGGAQFLIYTLPLVALVLHLYLERVRGMRSNKSLERSRER